jgi:hypothetical protein
VGNELKVAVKLADPAVLDRITELRNVSLYKSELTGREIRHEFPAGSNGVGSFASGGIKLEYIMRTDPVYIDDWKDGLPSRGTVKRFSNWQYTIQFGLPNEESLSKARENKDVLHDILDAVEYVARDKGYKIELSWVKLLRE